MSRQERRRAEREAQKRGAAYSASPGVRPWYYRYGYHLGVASTVPVTVGLFLLFGNPLIAIIVGFIFGQVAGILLSRGGRNPGT